MEFLSTDIKAEETKTVWDAWNIKEELTIENIVFQSGPSFKFPLYNDLLKEAPRLCTICENVFLNSYSYLQHNLTHLELRIDKLKPLYCQRCPEKFYTDKDLKKHINSVHFDGNQKLVECEICNKIYVYKNLWEHLRNVHSKKEYMCSICKKVFKNEVNLKRHKKYVHEGVCPPWKLKKPTMVLSQCSECPKSFKSKESLRLHISNCHSKEIFVCDICGGIFKSRPYIATHMKRVHYDDGNLYSCDICCKTFNDPRKVRRHKKNSHKIVSRLKFQYGTKIKEEL